MLVADDRGKRSLYFGDGILQSSILLDSPGMLLEDYHQAMMTALLFLNNPQSVLMIGLGGCSLVHFLLRALPECSIDIAEVRPLVIELAHDFFLLPRERQNVNMFLTAGQDFVLPAGERRRRYDLIIVDAFDNEGPAAPLLEKEFFEACRAKLNNNAVFVINLWNRPKDNFPALYGVIQKAFGNNTLKLMLGEIYKNVIVLGVSNPALFGKIHACRPVVRRLQDAYGVNFLKYQRYLYWQNVENVVQENA